MAEKQKGFDLAAALGAVSNLDTGTEGREQLKYMDFETIHPDPGNFYSMDGVEELAGNIELIGLQQPLRVRPDPEHEGEYIVVSGHRRRAAIELLVKEGKFGLVPCLIDGHQESDAMRQLRLIMANNSTRKLTSADLSKQAEEVEKLLYRLKEEGTEFPGRMRDHVAEVCQVHASKLARLKVIREGLIDDLKQDWEKGDLGESVAYAFAKQTPEVQNLIVLSITKFGTTNDNRKWWLEWQVKQEAEQISEELKPRKGPKGTCESCDATKQRLKRMIGHSEWDDHCGKGKCCHGCPNIGTCAFVCSHLGGEVAKAKVAALNKKKAEREQKQKEDAKQVAPTVRLWKRFGEARARAGLTFEEYAKKADARGFIREKKVADFEQGQKITPSSGGLPYAGGNGVDEWLIRPLIKAADALGCSIDYLLCRTDEPGGSQAPRTPAQPSLTVWQTGDPDKVGAYVCKVPWAGRESMEVIKWDGTNWDMCSAGFRIDDKVLRWCPIPEDDEKDPEDDDGDMDDLHYGAEDDDDYAREAQEETEEEK